VNRPIVLLALAWAILPAGAEKVHVDFDHGRHFSRYNTYSWLEPTGEQTPDTLFPNQLMRERIAGFIEEVLAAKGLRPVASGGDLLVSYQVNVTELPMYTTFGDGWGWGWGDGISTTTTEMTYEGTLVVDMLDAHQKQLVFQGVSTMMISSKPAHNTKKLGKAVNEIFEKYPPQM
jgi:hypothetical protein